MQLFYVVIGYLCGTFPHSWVVELLDFEVDVLKPRWLKAKSYNVGCE